jgi:hypothetical protein
MPLANKDGWPWSGADRLVEALAIEETKDNGRAGILSSFLRLFGISGMTGESDTI